MLLWILVGTVILICWRISLSVRPYTSCRSCGGRGRNSWSNARFFGPCRKCGGSGRKERLGRRLLGIGKHERRGAR